MQKDWKKQKSYRNQYAWKNKDKLLIVMKDNFSSEPYWYVIMVGSSKKRFKYKEEALSYAKDIMRRVY